VAFKDCLDVTVQFDAALCVVQERPDSLVDPAGNQDIHRIRGFGIGILDGRASHRQDSYLLRESQH